MLLARIQKKPCQFWCPEWVSCSSSINFKVSDLKYRSLIHFELVRDKGLILVSVCGHPNFQGHLCKNFPFSNAYSNFSKYAAKASTQCMFLPLLLYVSWLQMYGFISRVYILSIDLWIWFPVMFYFLDSKRADLYTDRGTDGDGSSITWFIPKFTATAGSEIVWSQEPWSHELHPAPLWVQGPQLLWPLHSFPGPLGGSLDQNWIIQHTQSLCDLAIYSFNT